MIFPEILYEDNHLLAVNKPVGMPVQGDKSRDPCVIDRMKIHLKNRDSKPGAVFMGLPHRLDRPVGGALILAKTSKALARAAEAFRNGEAVKLYWAVVEAMPDPPEGERVDWLRKDEKANKSRRVAPGVRGGKEARLRYRTLAASKNFRLVEVELITGRHHQIRAQLSAMGAPVKGDLKYGARRSNRGGGIHLHARRLELPHPTRDGRVIVVAPLPDDAVWNAFGEELGGQWSTGVFSGSGGS